MIFLFAIKNRKTFDLLKLELKFKKLKFVGSIFSSAFYGLKNKNLFLSFTEIMIIQLSKSVFEKTN